MLKVNETRFCKAAAMKCAQGSSAYLGLHRYTKVHGPKQGNPVAPFAPYSATTANAAQVQSQEAEVGI